MQRDAAHALNLVLQNPTTRGLTQLLHCFGHLREGKHAKKDVLGLQGKHLRTKNVDAAPLTCRVFIWSSVDKATPHPLAWGPEITYRSNVCSNVRAAPNSSELK